MQTEFYPFVLLSHCNCLAVPYISHLQLFRILQHKQAPNITVPLQHQGAYIKCHQSASNFLTVTELVQRLRRRLTQSVNDTTLPLIIYRVEKKSVCDGLKVAKTQCRHHFIFGAAGNRLPLRLHTDWMGLVSQGSEWPLNS